LEFTKHLFDVSLDCRAREVQRWQPACSIELYVDRTDVLSNERLVMEADMVAMVSDGSVATLRHHREARAESPVRTVPLRLTGRGRVVATGVSALVIGLLSVTLATAAQATHDKHGGAGKYDRYPAKVTVAPGDSLWSVAEAYDPGADPRVVIERMRELNSLTGDQVRPGEVLWVPRG
jgi:LysM domain-containing protein